MLVITAVSSLNRVMEPDVALIIKLHLEQGDFKVMSSPFKTIFYSVESESWGSLIRKGQQISELLCLTNNPPAFFSLGKKLSGMFSVLPFLLVVKRFLPGLAFPVWLTCVILCDFIYIYIFYFNFFNIFLSRLKSECRFSCSLLRQADTFGIMTSAAHWWDYM